MPYAYIALLALNLLTVKALAPQTGMPSLLFWRGVLCLCVVGLRKRRSLSLRLPPSQWGRVVFGGGGLALQLSSLQHLASSEVLLLSRLDLPLIVSLRGHGRQKLAAAALAIGTLVIASSSFRGQPLGFVMIVLSLLALTKSQLLQERAVADEPIATLPVAPALGLMLVGFFLGGAKISSWPLMMALAASGAMMESLYRLGGPVISRYGLPGSVGAAIVAALLIMPVEILFWKSSIHPELIITSLAGIALSLWTAPSLAPVCVLTKARGPVESCPVSTPSHLAET